MDTHVPLSLTVAAAQGTPVKSFLVTGGCAKYGRHTRMVEGPGGWFSVYDATCALLCSAEGKTVTVCCAVLSRKQDTDSIFSCAMKGELYDVGPARGRLTRSPCTSILQSTENTIQNVGFVEKQLVVGTRGGDLAVLHLPSGATAVEVGQCVRPCERPCSPDLCVWAFNSVTALCVGLTEHGLWSYRLSAEAPPFSSWLPLDLSLSGLSDATVSQRGLEEEATLVACASIEHKAVSLTIDGTLTSIGQQHEYTLLDVPVDTAQFSRSAPQCYSHAMWNEQGHLSAMVYPDSVIFCTVYDGEITCTTALRNELNLTFECGRWTQHTYTRTREVFELAVTRSDGACLLYSVVVEKGQHRFCELVLNGYIILAHPASTRMAAGSFYEDPPAPFWLSVSSVEDVLSNAPGAVVRHDGGTKGQMPCTIVNNVSGTSANSLLLLEVIMSQDEFGLLTLLSTGECLLVTRKGQTLVAKEEEAEARSVTAICAFTVAGDRYGAVGRRDGSVKFFVNGMLKASLRMVHCGAVDQLVLLPAYEFSSGDVDDALVMSVCTQMGTVCLHSGTSGDVVCILCSPSRPLTGCFLDRKSQYMRAFSGEAGNLWHIPTCRLERTFTCASHGLERGEENLLCLHSASLLRVEHSRLLGAVYFSVHIGVTALVGDSTPLGSGAERHTVRSRGFVAALSLLLQSCKHDSVPNTFCSRALTVLTESGMHAHFTDSLLKALSLTAAPDESEHATWGLFTMLCNLITKRGDVNVTMAAYQLATELLDAAVRDKTPQKQATVLLGFYCTFFDGEPACVPTTMARFGLRRLLSSVQLTAVLTLLDARQGGNWALLASTASQNGGTLSAHLLFSLVLTALGYCCEGSTDPHTSAPIGTTQRPEVEAVVLETVKSFSRQYQSSQVSSEAFYTSGTTSTASADEMLAQRLTPIAAGLPFVRTFMNEHDFVWQMCVVVLSSSSPEPAIVATDGALQCAASHDIGRFLTDTARQIYAQKSSWRVRLLVFLTSLIRNYPFDSYCWAAELVEFAVTALDPQAPEKDSKAMCTAAVAEMLRVAVATLPNVSFQQNLQQLAVGNRTGDIKVYSLRTAALVTTIAALKEPVMAVSYSSNTSSYDIAVIPESMTTVRVWCAAKPGSGLTSFLTGYTVQFKCVNEVELPSAVVSTESRPVLLPLCTLKWLSPQCIWFLSPWHGKIELSLAHK